MNERQSYQETLDGIQDFNKLSPPDYQLSLTRMWGTYTLKIKSGTLPDFKLKTSELRAVTLVLKGYLLGTSNGMAIAKNPRKND